MDILLIILDQCSAQALGAYGNAWAATPQLDALANRGLRLDACITPAPLCRPARAAFWSGLHPHQTRVLSNGGHWQDPLLPETVPTLGAAFSAAGWRCLHYGKEHDHGALRGFVRHRCPRADRAAGSPEAPAFGDSRDDAATLPAALAELERPDGPGPRLVAVDLVNPHDICSWVGAAGSDGCALPAPGRLPPLPANFACEDLALRPAPVRHVCCAHRRQAQAAGWGEEGFRRYLAAYHRYLGVVDGQVGELLAALERSGRQDRTLVLLTADHGDAMTAHGLVTKHSTLYEETVRVPFLAAGPGVVARGGHPGLASLLDLWPTLAELAGLPPPTGVAGRSLAPVLRGGLPPARDYVVSQWHTEWGDTVEPARLVRSPGWAYMRWREDDAEELYDLAADPGQTRNRAADPACAGALARHRAWLQEHCAASGDPFFSLPWKAEDRWRSHAVGYRHHQGPAAPCVPGGSQHRG